MKSQISPQQKLISVNRKLGNNNIKKQQGTTRILYDTLPFPSTREWNFFENASNRQFPFTNAGSFGNKLEAGESIVVQRISLALVVPEQQADGGYSFSTIESIDNTAASILGAAELSLEIGNTTVLKPVPVLEFFPQFNKTSDFANNGVSQGGQVVYHLDTLITIPPLLDYVFYLRSSTAPDAVEFVGYEIRLTYEGVGSIINTRHTY